MSQPAEDRETRDLELEDDSLDPMADVPEPEPSFGADLSDPYLADDDYEEVDVGDFDFSDFSDGDSDAEFDRYFRNSEPRRRGRGRRRRRRGRSWEDALDFGSFEDRDDDSRGRRPRR